MRAQYSSAASCRSVCVFLKKRKKKILQHTFTFLIFFLLHTNFTLIKATRLKCGSTQTLPYYGLQADIHTCAAITDTACCYISQDVTSLGSLLRELFTSLLTHLISVVNTEGGATAHLEAFLPVTMMLSDQTGIYTA